LIIDFAPWHVEMMSLTPARAAEVQQYSVELETLGRAGWMRTIVADRGGHVDVLGVAGVVPVEDGEGEAFIVMAENASRKEFVKGARQLLDLIRGHFATIRALGDEGNPRIERWLSWLGFAPTAEARLSEGKRMIVWRLA